MDNMLIRQLYRFNEINSFQRETKKHKAAVVSPRDTCNSFVVTLSKLLLVLFRSIVCSKEL